MSEVMMASVALAGLNAALALVVGAVYVKNHRAIRSPFTLGLLLFAAFLAVHNGMVVYHFLTMMAAPAPSGEAFLLAESVLQAGALAALVGATLR